MKDPNPIIPLKATLNGLNVVFKGLRKLPIDEAADLLNELVGQANEFIKGVEAEEKATEEASAKAVEVVAKSLIAEVKPKAPRRSC